MALLSQIFGVTRVGLQIFALPIERYLFAINIHAIYKGFLVPPFIEYKNLHTYELERFLAYFHVSGPLRRPAAIYKVDLAVN